jgi:hypothetical protein
MEPHEIDLPTFRLLYPAFANPMLYPDAYVTAQFTAATAYFGQYDGPLINGAQLQNVLNLMTAHLMQINVMLSGAGQSPVIGVLSSATIDKVSVTNTPPPAKDGWQYWLSTTPYGLQLRALLKVLSAGGLYVGGSPERSAFRKIGGRFGW